MIPPLIFQTQYKDKIWGGNKIHTVLGKDFSPLPNCGETWELSGVKGNISVVKGGPHSGKEITSLISKFKERLLGRKIIERFGEEFPLLIKFIDANDDLSIQVHPNDQLAEQRHNSKGKTEMWYILGADEGAWLYNGFSTEISSDEYQARIEANTITEVLHKEYVNPGDIYFIPAGRVHSIGKGILLAEIQQTSDITYRIYDFDRRDAEGNTRELHTEESREAIDFTVINEARTTYQTLSNEAVKVVECPYFSTSIINVSSQIEVDISDRDSFTILICAEGTAKLETQGQTSEIRMGDVILIPAESDFYKLFSPEHCKLLETYIP